jgi:transposase, IS5 family
VTRDIMRKITGQAELESGFALPLSLSRRGREQRNAPEVERIGKGKAYRPWEFDVKVSLATTFHRSRAS